MRRYAVRVGPQAELEIDERIEWWQERDPLRARAIVNELEYAYGLIARFPEIGAPIKVRGTWSTTKRRLVLGRIGCLLFYEVNKETGRIYVIRFLHQRQRLPKL